jgi:hypothetical protein
VNRKKGTLVLILSSPDPQLIGSGLRGCTRNSLREYLRRFLFTKAWWLVMEGPEKSLIESMKMEGNYKEKNAYFR